MSHSTTWNWASVCLAVLALVPASPALAARPAAELLPASTCAYISLPQVEATHTAFRGTQLGELVQDPKLKPFIEDLGGQLRKRLADTEVRLGLKWEDLSGIYAGEACVARLNPTGKKNGHATVLLVDVTGRDEELKRVRAKLSANLKSRKATTQQASIQGVDVTIHQLPKRRGKQQQTIYSFVQQDMFVVANEQTVTADIAKRLNGPSTKDSLSAQADFAHVMKQLADASTHEPDIRWYINPFTLVEVIRAARNPLSLQKNTLASALKGQGFDAIRGVGGHIKMGTAKHELLHRTMVYAPPTHGGPSKYQKAAQMLAFPATKQLPLENWIPRNLASYMSFNWNVAQAFEHSIELIDERTGGPGFVEDVLKSFEEDEEVQLNFRTGLLQQLGEKIIKIADHRRPITPKSERLLVAIQVKDAAAVQLALRKLWKDDPIAHQHKLEGHVVWEIVQDSDDLQNLQAPSVPIPGGGRVDPSEAENEIKLPNSAMTVAHGYWLISTDIELLTEVLKGRPEHSTLGNSADFAVINDALEQLGAGDDSFRFFSRTDEQYRNAYEMIKAGKMPQSESVLGRLLNRMFGPEDSNTLRRPQLDGSSLPPYQMVRRYLGPAGTFVQPRKDGWFATGIMLDKQKLAEQSANTPAALTDTSKP